MKNNMRDAFECEYKQSNPDDRCTQLPNGNYSGNVKQKHWEEFKKNWISQSVDIDLTEDEQQEFVQFISRWSVECYFEGQQCVIPSGQGHSVPQAIGTALAAWKYQIKKTEGIMSKFKKSETEAIKLNRLG